MPRRMARACFAVVLFLSVVLAQQDDEALVYIRPEGTRKAKSQKVLGLGVGVFLVAFFFIVALILCASGLLMPAERNEGWIFNLVGTLLFFLVSAVLLLAEPEPRYSSTEKTVQGYDGNTIGLVVILVMLLIAAGLGGGSVLCYHVCAPIEAASIRTSESDGRSRSGVFDSRGNCIAKQPTLSV
ncbi:hypothetical protein M885DRAFT_505352 [Pelagophyceae sp. CCMP2097]|nr:hypothetical protein M885DRAFT_505352 [Pelagophyceae sp. CCMP2097]